MTKEEFLTLYQKFLQNACTQEEIDQLYAYQDDMKLEDGEWEGPVEEQVSIRDTIRVRLNEQIGETIPARRRIPAWSKWAAAALLAGLTFGLYYNDVYRNAAKLPVQQTAGKQQSVPHTDAKKTYLTLGNGQVISLTDAAKGTITDSLGIVTSKQGDGWITYEAASNEGRPAIPDTNSIQTPFGERFSVTLADGSKVWLNAASGLRFPVYFTAGTREVYLTGEACFKVKADPSHPFIVHVNGVAVQALGTEFNIKSHAEERNTVATLLEGTVRVTLPAKEAVLKPGQQILYDADNGRSHLQKANTRTVLAWRDGVFAFENEPVSAILYEIGRWYNKEVVFVRGNFNRRFTYKLQRNESLEEALITLELASGIQVTTTKTKIMVTIP